MATMNIHNSTRRERIDYLRTLPDGKRRNALRAMKAAKPAKKAASKKKRARK